MEIHFLGGATTVTGSQHLLVTGQAKVLIDCGMFQGSPNESIRNRLPFDFDPATIDGVLLTHAHLDHCGLIPNLVKAGYRGPIHATPGTIELATLVLLDSGKLHEEFAKRGARWEKRHPDEAAAEDRDNEASYEAAVALAADGEDGIIGNAATTAGPPRAPSVRRPPASMSRPPSSPTSTRRPRRRGRPTPKPTSARNRRTCSSTSMRRCTRRATPSGRSRASGPSNTGRSSRSRPGSRPSSRTPATSSARRSSG